MKRTGRILLVEDIPNTRESYTDLLEEVGFSVVSVGDLPEALSALDRVTFHVALVDIMLAGEKNTVNRDGVIVINRIAELDEGTKAIPLTGQDKRSFVRDAFKEMAVFDFLDKTEDIGGKGWDYALGIIEKAIAECEIDDTPSWSELSGPVFAPGEEQGFVSMVTHRIPGAKLDVLQQQLPNCVRKIQPLRANTTDDVRFHWDEEKDAVVGEFWSKSYGNRVWIVIDNGDPILEEFGGAIISSRGKGKLRISAILSDDGVRDEFI